MYLLKLEKALECKVSDDQSEGEGEVVIGGQMKLELSYREGSSRASPTIDESGNYEAVTHSYNHE